MMNLEPPTPPSNQNNQTPQSKPNRPKWEVEDTHPELVEEVQKALRTVVDPEIGLDVIALGLIRNIQVTDEGANVVMILTTPFCPYGPALLEMARQKVEQVVGKPTTIEVGTEIWDRSMMEDDALAMWGLY